MNMRKAILSIWVATCLIAVITSSCGHRGRLSKKEKAIRAEQTKQDSIAAHNEAIAIYNSKMLEEGYEKATVIDNTGLDGCRFMLQLESGKKLQPTNLEEQYLKNGKQLWIKYVVQKDAMSVCMAGDVVNITSIGERY